MPFSIAVASDPAYRTETELSGALFLHEVRAAAATNSAIQPDDDLA
jgi:hypothetical protein